MPELPEVETTRRGIAPHAEGNTITGVVVYNRRLRWPISARLGAALTGQTITHIRRRAKYLIFDTAGGSMIIHLGMSGSLRLGDAKDTLKKHDHLEVRLGNGRLLRFNDPRRFGSVFWTTAPPDRHKRLAHLGAEPLAPALSGAYLHTQAAHRKTNVKHFIMDARVVVGVGNIYASESLHTAGIHPKRPAGNISRPRYEKLAQAIKTTLTAAIESGGSTLNDFVKPDGKPGYFQHQFRVYGKAGRPCGRCGAAIKKITQGQRSTYYCAGCQR